jgi:hypothetical protein
LNKLGLNVIRKIDETTDFTKMMNSGYPVGRPETK